MKYTCMFARLFRKFEQCMTSFVEHFANFAIKLEMFIIPCTVAYKSIFNPVVVVLSAIYQWVSDDNTYFLQQR